MYAYKVKKSLFNSKWSLFWSYQKIVFFKIYTVKLLLAKCRNISINFPFINSLKIQKCATNQDRLLLASLWYSNFSWDYASFETAGARWKDQSQFRIRFRNLKEIGIKSPTVRRRWRRLRLAFPFHSILMPDGCFSTPMVLFSTHTYCATTLLCLS